MGKISSYRNAQGGTTVISEMADDYLFNAISFFSKRVYIDGIRGEVKDLLESLEEEKQHRFGKKNSNRAPIKQQNQNLKVSSRNRNSEDIFI